MLNEGDPSKVVSAYSALRATLQEYRIRPGLHLKIDDISQQMKLSVTPVREALARLWVERMVDNVPNKGYFVKAIDAKEQFELHDAKNAILGHALQLAIDENKGPVPVDIREAYSVSDQVAILYTTICALTGNGELNRILECHSARRFFLRQIDCEINEPKNRLFISEMSGLLRTGAYKDASQVYSSHRKRLKDDMPMLLKEAAGRAGLKHDQSFRLDKSCLARTGRQPQQSSPT